MSVTAGQRARRSLTLTADHVKTFAQLTGDYNPLHFDPEFAGRTKFGKLVVQGGLTPGCCMRWSPWTFRGRAPCS